MNVYNTTVINVTKVYVNSRVNNGVVVVRKDHFLRGKIREGRIAATRNPFEGGAGGVKIIARPPVREIEPIRETRQSRPDSEIKRKSLPPVRLERESRVIRERVVAPTKEKSVFKPGKKPVVLKNVHKEKELEQQRVKNADDSGKPDKARLPAGKHRFKRVSEPAGGGEEAPGRKSDADERSKGEKEKQNR